MELSGQNITIIVVTLAVVALLFYVVAKGRNAKVSSRFGGNEVGVEVSSPSQTADAVPKAAPPAPTSLGNISQVEVQRNATIKGPQSVHVGHNVGASGSAEPSTKRDS
jgi:hypothetical protein